MARKPRSQWTPDELAEDRIDAARTLLRTFAKAEDEEERQSLRNIVPHLFGEAGMPLLIEEIERMERARALRGE